MITDPLAYLVDTYQELGPVFRVRALHRRFTVLAGPQANQFMSRDGDAHLSGREDWATFADEIDSKYFLAAIDGQDHARLRSIIKKPYSRRAVLARLPELVSITRDMAAGWQVGEPFVVFPTVQRLVAEQIGQLLLGSGPGDKFGDFVIFMRTLLNAVLGQWPKFTLRLPRYRAAKARLMALAQDMLAAHRAQGISVDEPDLVDYLLEAAVENSDILTEPELLIGVLGPYLAGIDTAAGTTSFMLYALLKHPDTLVRLITEIDAAFDSGPLTAQKLRQMDILHAAALETLRMYPVAPMLPRHVIQPFEFGGFRLEAGEALMMANGVAHFDPQLYQDPKFFDIDRCLAPRNEHRQPGAFAPYGLGAHTCAGAGFAEVEIMVTVATLLRDFELEIAPSDYELRTTFSPSPAPDRNFRIRVAARRGQRNN
jgi:cytochrome P450